VASSAIIVALAFWPYSWRITLFTVYSEVASPVVKVGWTNERQRCKSCKYVSQKKSCECHFLHCERSFLYIVASCFERYIYTPTLDLTPPQYFLNIFFCLGENWDGHANLAHPVATPLVLSKVGKFMKSRRQSWKDNHCVLLFFGIWKGPFMQFVNNWIVNMPRGLEKCWQCKYWESEYIIEGANHSKHLVHVDEKFVKVLKSHVKYLWWQVFKSWKSQVYIRPKWTRTLEHLTDPVICLRLIS
jgi:hypothetical protein